MLLEILANNPSSTEKEVSISLESVGIGWVAFDPEVVVGIIKLKEIVAELL